MKQCSEKKWRFLPRLPWTIFEIFELATLQTKNVFGTKGTTSTRGDGVDAGDDDGDIGVARRGSNSVSGIRIPQSGDTAPIRVAIVRLRRDLGTYRLRDSFCALGL